MRSSPSRHAFRLLATVVVAATAWLALSKPGRAATGVVLPPDDPAVNLAFPGLGSLGSVNLGRAREGLAPISTDGFGFLTVPEQVFAILNLERTARGLPPFTAMTQSLDVLSQVGADSASDPPAPPAVGSPFASDGIESGTTDPLLADFGWMYEDGCTFVPNQQVESVDCEQSPPVAWDHRNRILSLPGGTDCNLYFGAAVSKAAQAIAADFEFYCGAAAPADQVFTWAQALQILGGASPGPTAPPAPATPTVVHCSPPAFGSGYRMVASDGGIFSYGSLPFCGSTGGIALHAPVVGMADTPDHGGYWLVASDGGVFAFGDAGFYGSMGGTRLRAPIVGIAAATFGNGYWLVASDGGVFAFGAARDYGSTGGVPLRAPIVGIATSPFGLGYWLVASDGGVFAFGAARYFGSTGATALHAPVVGIAASPFGNGYWLVASDGGVFCFGFPGFHGSLGGVPLDRPIVGIAVGPFALGYWLVASDGGVFAFGSARYFGSMGGHALARPVVGMST